MPRKTRTPPPSGVSTIASSSERQRTQKSRPVQIFAEPQLSCKPQRNLININSDFSPPLLGSPTEFCTEAFVKGLPVRGISFTPVKELQPMVQPPCDFCKVETIKPKRQIKGVDYYGKLYESELCQKQNRESFSRTPRPKIDFMSRKFSNVNVYYFEPSDTSEDEEPNIPTDSIAPTEFREPSLTYIVPRTKIIESSVDGPLRLPKPRVKTKAQIKAEQTQEEFMKNFYWKWDRPVVEKPETTASKKCSSYKKVENIISTNAESMWLENNYEQEPQINYCDIIEEEEDVDDLEMIRSYKMTPEEQPEDEPYKEVRGPILRIEGQGNAGNVCLKYCPPGQKQSKIYCENLDGFSANTKCKDVRHIMLHNIGTTVIRYQFLRSKPTQYLRNLLKNPGRTLSLEVDVIPDDKIPPPNIQVEKELCEEVEYLGEDEDEFSGYDLHSVKDMTAFDKLSSGPSIATNIDTVGMPLQKTSTQMFTPTIATGDTIDENGCCTCKCPLKKVPDNESGKTSKKSEDGTPLMDSEVLSKNTTSTKKSDGEVQPLGSDALSKNTTSTKKSDGEAQLIDTDASSKNTNSTKKSDGILQFLNAEFLSKHRRSTKKSDGILHFMDSDTISKIRTSDSSDDDRLMHLRFPSAGTLGVTSSYIKKFLDQRRSTGTYSNITDFDYPSSMRSSQDFYKKFSDGQTMHGDEDYGEGHHEFNLNDLTDEDIKILKHAFGLDESGHDIDHREFRRNKCMGEAHVITSPVFDFHYPSKPSCLLPGQSIKIEIIFRPRKQGFFTETLYLLTHPKLGKSIYSLRLKGVCVDPAIRKSSEQPSPEEQIETIRNKVYKTMYEKQAYQATAAIIDHVILLNETRTNTLPNGDLTSEAMFKAHNPKFHHHPKWAKEGLRNIRKVLELLVPAERINDGKICQLNIQQMYKELLKPAKEVEYFTQNYSQCGDEIEKLMQDFSKCTKHLAKPRVFYMQSREKRMYNAVYSTMNSTFDEICDKINASENSPGFEYLVKVMKKDIHENWKRKELKWDEEDASENEEENPEDDNIEDENSLQDLETNREDVSTQFPESVQLISPPMDEYDNMSRRLSMMVTAPGEGRRKLTRKRGSSGDKALKPSKKFQERLRRGTGKSALAKTKSIKIHREDGGDAHGDETWSMKPGTSEMDLEAEEEHLDSDYDDFSDPESSESDHESSAPSIEPGSEKWFETELKKAITTVQTPLKTEIIESLLANGIERMIATLDSMTYLKDYEPCQVIKRSEN